MERYEKSKHTIRIGIAKSKIVVDEGMKLIFNPNLKSAIDVDHLCLIVLKQLGVGT